MVMASNWTSLGLLTHTKLSEGLGADVSVL